MSRTLEQAVSDIETVSREKQLEVFEKIFLGRTIIRLEINKDMEGNDTGGLSLFFNDGGFITIHNRVDQIAIYPAVDNQKALAGMSWEQAMPDVSYELIKHQKEAAVHGVPKT